VPGPAYGPGGPAAPVFPPFPAGPTASGGPGSGPGGGSPGPPGGGVSGGPGAGPGNGPASGSGPSTGSTGGPSGSTTTSTGTGTTASGGSTDAAGYYVDPGFNSSIASGFMNILQNATSPDALNAQSIILRRIALEGDVIGSRVPPPRNITEIGGYLNYLTTTNQAEMRSQVLAGILGVAGPNPPLGWLSSGQPVLTFVKISNDRPSGPAQPSIPLSVMVRSDFADAFKAALAVLHGQGAMLPLQNGPTTLPPATPGGAVPADALPFLGRTLDVVAATALVDPVSDSIALVRAAGTSNPYEIAARVLSAGSVPVPPANYDAVQCTATTASTVALTAAKLVPIAGPLHAAGFYEASPMPMPATLSSTAWARLTNVTGLIKNVTKLGDELSLLYGWADIQNSVFANSLALVWDGTAFSTP
jgi:hypothetical protein